MMTIKLLCPCGAKFAFDLPEAPAEGKLPSAVHCPVCHADATALAEGEIERVAASQRVRVPAVQPETVSSPSGGVFPASEGCAKHPQNPAAANCVVCGKAVCLDCMAQFGYVCSPYCREAADRKGIAIPAYAHQKTSVALAESRKRNLVLGALAGAAVLAAGFWAMYSFMLSKPRPAFQIAAAKSAPFVFAQWAEKSRVVAATTEKLMLAEAPSGQTVWEAEFKADEKSGDRSGAGTESFFTSGPEISARLAGGDVWVFFARRAVRFDLAAGKRKQEVPLPAGATERCANDDIFVAAAAAGPNAKTVSRLDLASGQVQTAVVPSPPRPGISRALAVIRAQAGAEGASEADDLPECEREFFASESSVVQLQSRILQLRVGRAGAAGKEQDAPDLLDSGSLRASQSNEAVEQFLARSSSGQVPEDQSRYSVSLKRVFGGGSSWSGEVIGAPAFFPMAGVDLLIAGKTVLAFSKAGQKQWEGKLSFSIAPQHVEEARQAPALEAAGKLYVFDQGALTAFDARDGAVKWRVQSVGIRKVAQDARGGLYMVTTTAGADQIEASRNIGPGSKINTLLMKLDGATGAILWQAPGLADDVLLSGKMVYAARGRVSGVDLFSAASSSDPDAAAPVHHRIYRIDPKNGREKWEYYRPFAPSHIEPKSNFILLQYPAEVQVLKFMAL